MTGNLLLVAAGGGAGAVLRYLLSLAFGRGLFGGWPWPTFTANIAGGLAMGLLAGWLSLRGGVDHERIRLLLGVGLLGGFTTFSSYAFQAVELWESGRPGLALASVVASNLLGFIAVWGGLKLAG
jgi:CrcB protein